MKLEIRPYGKHFRIKIDSDYEHKIEWWNLPKSLYPENGEVIMCELKVIRRVKAKKGEGNGSR